MEDSSPTSEPSTGERTSMGWLPCETTHSPLIRFPYPFCSVFVITVHLHIDSAPSQMGGPGAGEGRFRRLRVLPAACQTPFEVSIAQFILKKYIFIPGETEKFAPLSPRNMEDFPECPAEDPAVWKGTPLFAKRARGGNGFIFFIIYTLQTELYMILYI